MGEEERVARASELRGGAGEVEEEPASSGENWREYCGVNWRDCRMLSVYTGEWGGASVYVLATTGPPPPIHLLLQRARLVPASNATSQNNHDNVRAHTRV